VIPLRDSETLLSRPVVTHVLIALNVAVFLYELTLGPELEGFVRTWGFIPARYFWLTPLDPEEWVARYLPLLGSMFLHGGWAHLIGNMVYLWIFGDNVEDRLGHGRYLVFYVVCGVSASLAQAYLHPDSLVPTVGASGAISGVLGAYLVLFPYARVLTLVPLLALLPTHRGAGGDLPGSLVPDAAHERNRGTRADGRAGGSGMVGARRRIRGRGGARTAPARAAARSAKVAGPVRFVVNERPSIQGGTDGYR
jgi:membrane associated rhomboid family serine protease